MAAISTEWRGNIDQLERAAAAWLEQTGKDDSPTIRVIRDYVRRGILGKVSKKGKELAFEYRHLAKLVAARLLVADGMSLTTIGEQFSASDEASIVALIADQAGRFRFGQNATRTSAIQAEMRDALHKLGLPPNRVATENLTLVAIAPWCQVLFETKRLSRINAEEAQEIGRLVRAYLLSLMMKTSKTVKGE